MNKLDAPIAVLAQISKWKHLGDGLKGTRSPIEFSDAWPYMLIAAGLAGAAFLFVYWKRRRDFSRRCNDPYQLFRELCAIHELNGSHQRMLKRLAQELQLHQPAQVFLTPSAFGESGLPESLRDREQEYAVLRDRLF